MQSRFERRRGKQAFRILAHKRFRAAYDFLVLRAKIGEAKPELAEWWTEFQEVGHSKQQAMVQALSKGAKKQTGKRRR